MLDEQITIVEPDLEISGIKSAISHYERIFSENKTIHAIINIEAQSSKTLILYQRFPFSLNSLFDCSNELALMSYLLDTTYILLSVCLN